MNLDINYIVVANFKEMALDLIKKGYDNIINYIYDAEILKQKIDGETILYRLLSSNVFDEDLLETLLDGLKDDCFSFEYNGSEIIESIENTSLMESFWFRIFKAKHCYDYEFNESYIEVDYLNQISGNICSLDLLIMSNLPVGALEKSAKIDFNIALIYAKRKNVKFLQK